MLETSYIKKSQFRRMGWMKDELYFCTGKPRSLLLLWDPGYGSPCHLKHHIFKKHPKDILLEENQLYRMLVHMVFKRNTLRKLDNKF